MARRIATYKIGAFLLSACGLGLAPLVAATAELPLMAIPGLPPRLQTQYPQAPIISKERGLRDSGVGICNAITRLPLSHAPLRPQHAHLHPSPSAHRSPHFHILRNLPSSRHNSPSPHVPPLVRCQVIHNPLGRTPTSERSRKNPSV